MAVGLEGKFHILTHSPHDLAPCSSSEAAKPSIPRWVPSRYTVRATTEDGRLVLWNTYRGTMSVFNPEQKATIESLLQRRGFAGKPEGFTKYLSDRGFLIKEGSREYRQIQHDFGREHYRTDVLELILLASEDCNFRCTYCYEDFLRGTMEPWVRTGIKNLVHRRLPEIKTLRVTWFGGEPLYGWPAVEELAPFFSEISREHSLKFASSMTTNGYLLTPDVAEKLLGWGIKSYQITIDGPPEHHDRSRPARDGSGTFATIFDNLIALRSRPEKFSIDIRVNFDHHNHPHLGSFFDSLEREFKDDSRYMVRFRAVGRWGGQNDENLDVCGTQESNRIQLDLKEEARRRGLNVSDKLTRVQTFGSQVCYAARPYNYIVGANGNLMKCTIELDKNDRNIVGRLNEQGEIELDHDKFALWTEPAFESDTQCQKCVVLPVCQGIFCPLIRFETNRSPCTPLRSTYKSEMRELAAGAKPRNVVVKHAVPAQPVA